jgi:UDP-glucuronate 4-epimerase
MDVVHLIEENLGKKAKIDLQPMQPGDVPESFADIDKSKNLLGFQPKTDVEKGIKQFIQWYFQYFRNQN